MLQNILLVGSTLCALASAGQPSAPAPVAAPMRDLPWGDLNFLATTDTHGWHAGHLQEPQYSADWGDYISFSTRMKEKADSLGADLLLVDTGDRVDGNGLYDGSNPKGKYTYDIFREQQIDIICTGNHELYQADTAEREWTKTVPNFKDNYLASNLDIIDPKTGDRVPLAQRYKKFTTKNRGIRVVAFGFLFDFTGNANNTFVKPVKDTIKEDWFQEAIREKEVDIFVVIGHVALRSEEYKAIYKEIRSQKWDTPIQFFGGHSHIRDYMSYDSNAHALESGRYMETIGWMSIENIGSDKKSERMELSSKKSPKFARRYIDNNLFGYHYHTGLNDTTFPTEHGKNVSGVIKEARKSMDLDKTYGCAPQDLWLNRAEYPSNASMLSWLEDQVMPTILVDKDRKDTPKLAIINTGAVRFDIFKGPYTRDTVYIVCPFRNQFRMIKDLPYKLASEILKLLNQGGPVLDAVAEDHGLNAWMLPPPEQISVQQDFIVQQPRKYLDHNAQQALGVQKKPDLIPGYTTKDDGGDDGDDTLHEPISFYRVPNCLQAKVAFPSEGDPETVDVVFIDFVQPWVLMALNFLGHKAKVSDTEPYLEGQSFTHLMKDWIKDNWSQDC